MYRIVDSFKVFYPLFINYFRISVNYKNICYRFFMICGLLFLFIAKMFENYLLKYIGKVLVDLIFEAVADAYCYMFKSFGAASANCLLGCSCISFLMFFVFYY
jgi:hypothetical protein